jgi:hypothetical protein
MKGSLQPEIFGHRITEDIGKDPGRIDLALDPVMVGEATDNLLDDSNYPFILSGIDHVPVDIFNLDRH